ncbi:DUF5753 domain-containing protein [Glycomyces sp. A-F 0318]|uniref:Scr1 family TA system antitoxin-like transcriptional regulator n=1 Tax=Glycomyces amatae TaxID=2881355 RepID=UPI001E407BD5|nr:DUF5753 domain-containing protein [Glycomyces amatae]
MLYAERARPRPGWPSGITVAAVTRRRAAGASSIDRLEAGTHARVSPAMTTSLMFNVYESPPDLIKRVTELAEATMEPDWWTHYRPAEACWLWRHHVEQAAHVTVHDSLIIPDLVQCHAYAAALSNVGTTRMTGPVPGSDPLADRAASPQRLTCLIGEAALRLDIGAAAAAAQWRHLVALDALDNTDVYVVSFATGPYPLLGLEYGMLEFADGTDPLMMLAGVSSAYLDPAGDRARALRRSLHDSLARSVSVSAFAAASIGPDWTAALPGLTGGSDNR